MQTKKIIISIRARCTGQFIVYLAIWTFQSIQNYLYYLYKLSGKRLSGKMIVRETSCTGNNPRVRARNCPGNVFPGNVCLGNVFPGNVLSRKVIVQETSCPGNILSGNRLVRGKVLSGKCLVRETSCPGNICPGKWLSGKRPLPTHIQRRNQQVNRRHIKITYLLTAPEPTQGYLINNFLV